MITPGLLQIKRILFHPHILLNIGKHNLTETIIVDDIGKLWIHQLVHQTARGGGIVGLLTGSEWLISIK